MSTEKSKRTRANGEGTIFKHRNRWVVSCYDIQKVRRTTSFKKKVEAEDWLSAQRDARKRMQGTYVPKPKQTVEEYLWEWLPSRRHQVTGFNERIVDAHTALGDVVAVSKILPEMLNRIGQLYYPIAHPQLPSASVPFKAKTR